MYYSSNSFPQLTSSSPHSHSHSHANAFFSHHTPNENFLQDPFSYNFFPAPNTNADPCPFIIDNDVATAAAAAAAATATATATEGFVRALQVKEDHPLCDPLGNYLITNKKSSANKKDRHSMIFTAQGLRHRRVRLSIEISRKFFNLQDMLGFDKASQTLDWLFTNSKTAIQQLVQTNNYCLLPKSSSSASECDELKILSQNKGVEELNSKIHGTGNDKKSRSPNKETRVKARARARERTQQKQRIRKLDQEFKKRIPPQHENLISSRSSGENITMPALPISGTSLGDETSWKDIIVEAILTKKPLKSCLIDVYQQNMPVPEEIMVQSELFSHY